MNIATYNFARSHFSACCDALKRHLETCRVCVVPLPVPPDIYAYCEIGRACFDEALLAQRAFEDAGRNCVSGFCADCD